jgi:hypothetical protein
MQIVLMLQKQTNTIHFPNCIQMTDLHDSSEGNNTVDECELLEVFYFILNYCSIIYGFQYKKFLIRNRSACLT